MIYARQSTAIIVTVGPVLDASGVAVTDGVVGDFLVSKNGGAPAALNASATLTHRNTGHYSLSLTATDVNTVGTAEIVINDTTNACPIKEITVVEPATYDVLFADAAPGPASPTNITAGTITNVTTVNGLAANVITAAATAADFGTEVAGAVWDMDATGHQTAGTFGQAIGDPGADTNTIYGAVVTGAAGATIAADIIVVQADTDNIQTRLPAALVGGRMDSSVGAMAADVITAAAIANGAIDAATFAAGAIDAAAIAADAIGASEFSQAAADKVWSSVTRILTAGTNIVLAKGVGVTGFNDLDAAGVRAAVGLATANLDTQLGAIAGFIDTEVDLILTRLGVPAGASIAADIDAIPTANENRDAVWSKAMVELAAMPGATDTVLAALTILFMALRNKRDTSTTTDEIHNDAAAVIATAALSDVAGTFSKAKYI
jgi:predicted Fe-Mo cluster-binding NifX family protein